MEKFKYETHCHTNVFSACATASPKEMVGKFHKLGYAGLIITEHFNGSCKYDKTQMTWKEYVDKLYESYLLAKEEGDKVGLDVFFGFEYAFHWAHFLILGLGKDWLLNNPDILDVYPEQVLNRVRQDGGFVVHAHPFRNGVDRVILFPDLIDAVEVVNANRSHLSNYRSLKYAQMLDLPKVAGSDIHRTAQERLACIVTDRKIKDVNDYIQIIKDGTFHIETTP